MSGAATEREAKPAEAQLRPAPRPQLSDPLPIPTGQEIKAEVTPFNDPDWRVRLYNWCGFAVRVLAIVAAFVTAMQYFTTREEKRVERTLDLVTLWEQPRYQEAQKALETRLAPLRENARAMLGADATTQERRITAGQVGEAAMRAEGGAMPLPEFQEHFESIVYFLNRLSFCVEGGLCSRDVSDAYFRDFAESFWLYFSSYVEKRRRLSPNYAKPIEDYVKARRSGWLPAVWPFTLTTPSDPGTAAG